jgi:hypothetical protein
MRGHHAVHPVAKFGFCMFVCQQKERAQWIHLQPIFYQYFSKYSTEIDQYSNILTHIPQRGGELHGGRAVWRGDGDGGDHEGRQAWQDYW